ncbi:MAG: sigma-70 family RNA polymerase sigma factor [Ignavibacteriae bacterium]|nr:sigma-70 family RNA polymerase sigma factor [Ignavibacteriota bacterium]
MSPSSDVELIQRFQQGEEAAFNELVRRYQEKVYWLARRFVNDHDNADDIVQDVFIKAYDALKNFRNESGFYTWIYRITVNASLNAVRRERVRNFFRIDEQFEYEDTGTESPTEKVELQEQRALIEKAIETLPEKQKAVFILRYYDELPYEEIANILKTSVGGLKANYFHAVQKIGEYLKRANATRP